MCARVVIGFIALKIILDNLGYRKLCARWVPCMLIPDHKEQRVQASVSLLEQYETTGNELFDHIITKGETWLHRYKL
jgi:hypothetical protein